MQALERLFEPCPHPFQAFALSRLFSMGTIRYTLCFQYGILKESPAFLGSQSFTVPLPPFETAIALYSPDCPGTPYVDQAGLELTELLPCLLSAGIKGMRYPPGSLIVLYWCVARNLGCFQFGRLGANLPHRLLEWCSHGMGFCVSWKLNYLSIGRIHIQNFKGSRHISKVAMLGFLLPAVDWLLCLVQCLSEVGVPSFVSMLTPQPSQEVGTVSAAVRFAFIAWALLSPFSSCVSAFYVVLCDKRFFSFLILFSLRLFLITGLCSFL